ncbi:hypothetical protein TRIUR3_02307 [Triticum urartu]|uniref:VTT domain-containing protein n=1 Tax=Triticum urartu TaxID=4572 RepID=M8B2Z2_TRIUA|nr:hypothetical protein TRIUR3_02307 [Triticum urartu]
MTCCVILHNMIIESEQEDPVFDTEPYYRQGPLAEVDHQLPATWTAYLSMRQEIRDPQNSGLYLFRNRDITSDQFSWCKIFEPRPGRRNVGASFPVRSQIPLHQSQTTRSGYGTAGYALFILAYAGLEVLAIPAVPLTMSAGLLFGSVTGTIMVSISGTLAAAVAFLIARYFARERILKMVEGNKKFLAIDKAIGENGFKVVTLLRLSPLLPFSLGNYLYGLTSVKFLPYVLGSWLGMLPGTWAYVSAGAFGRAIIQDETEIGLGGNNQLLTLGIGLLVTAVAATYVTRLAKDAVKDIDDE